MGFSTAYEMHHEGRDRKQSQGNIFKGQVQRTGVKVNVMQIYFMQK